MFIPRGLIRHRAGVFFALLCALVVGIAMTRRPQVAVFPSRPAGIVDRLPADVELVIRIRDAERQLASAPGRAVARELAGSRLFSETEAAWARLSALLGWEPNEAFGRLAGQRLILAVAGPSAGGQRAWALLSDVDGDAERRLVKALRPAPRQTIAGQPVLSLEDGRFELAIFYHPDQAKAPARCTIVLAPTERGDLLDRIVQGLAGKPPGPTLADSPALTEAGALAGGDIFVMALRPGGEYIVLGASLADDGWHAILRASPGAIAAIRTSREPPACWSSEAFDTLASGATLLVISDGLLGLDRWAPLFMVPTLPEAAERLKGMLGRRTFLGMFAPCGPDGDKAQVTLAFGLETPDVGALAAPADAVVARLVAALEAGSGAGERDRPDFVGFLPKAPRAVPLTGAAASIWRPMLGPEPTLAWAFRSEPSAPEPAPGWWLMTLGPADASPAPASLASELGYALARRGNAGQERPRLTAGLIRVAQFVRWMSDIRADPAGVLSPLRCIERVRWDAWMLPDGHAEGTVDIVTSP